MESKSRTAYYITDLNRAYLRQAADELNLSMSYYLNLLIKNDKNSKNE